MNDCIDDRAAAYVRQALFKDFPKHRRRSNAAYRAASAVLQEQGEGIFFSLSMQLFFGDAAGRQTAAEKLLSFMCGVGGFAGVGRFTVQGPDTRLAGSAENYGPLDGSCNQYTPRHPRTPY